MTTFRTGLQINSPSVQKINLGKPQPLGNVINLNKALPSPQGLADPQKQVDLQNSVHQTTVIEKGGRVIVSFGEDGFRHFQNNSDYEPQFSTMSDSQVIDALNKRYGGSLTVNTYSDGQGPTFGEIFERIHGYPPPRHIDYNV